MTISGNNAVQVFSVSSDTGAALSGLTISQGNTNQGGGGINNQGTLTVTSCTFSNNSTIATGGGIENDGTLTITNSMFETNSAEFGGGIENEGTLSVTGSTIESNTAAFGGGIDNDENGTLTLTSTTFSLNTATSHGGGIFNSGASPLTVTGGTFSDNSAQSGGGIFLEGDGADPPIRRRSRTARLPATAPPAALEAAVVSITKVARFRCPAARFRAIQPPRRAAASLQTPVH